MQKVVPKVETVPLNMPKPTVYMFVGLHYGIVAHGEHWWRWPHKSIVDILTMYLDAAESKKVPLGWDVDGMTMEYLRLNEPRWPQVKERLLNAIRHGLFEIIDGTYSHPYHQYLSGESNIRQVELGKSAIRDELGIVVNIFHSNEPRTCEQLPQILKGLGYKYANIEVSHSFEFWRASLPVYQRMVAWEGIDGTEITAIPNINYELKNFLNRDGLPFSWYSEFYPLCDDPAKAPFHPEDLVRNQIGNFQPRYCRQQEYFEQVEKEDFPLKKWHSPRMDGRISGMWSGGELSGNKSKMRFVERNLLSTEVVSSIAYVLGHPSLEPMLSVAVSVGIAAA
jgi:hypothetical protein